MNCGNVSQFDMRSGQACSQRGLGFDKHSGVGGACGEYVLTRVQYRSGLFIDDCVMQDLRRYRQGLLPAAQEPARGFAEFRGTVVVPILLDG